MTHFPTCLIFNRQAIISICTEFETKRRILKNLINYALSQLFMIASQFVMFLIPKPQLVYVPSLRQNGKLNQVELNFKPSLSVLYVIYQSCQPFVSASLTSLLSASLVCNHISDCLEIWIQNGQKMFVVLICPYVLSFTYIIH